MTITLPAFTPLEESLFLTLCCRALDNRSEQPILGDAMADEIVRKLDYDYEAMHISTDLMLNATLRAKKLDEVASGSWPATRTRLDSTSAQGWTPEWFASTRRPR